MSTAAIRRNNKNKKHEFNLDYEKHMAKIRDTK